MAVEIAIAGWFAAPLITRLMNLAIDHYLPGDSVKVKLDRLRQNLDKIRTITDLDRRTKVEYSQSLSNWLWRFKDAVYDADDVIDAYEFHLSLAISSGGSSPASSSSAASTPSSSSSIAKMSNFIKNPTKFFRKTPRQKLHSDDIKQLDEVVKTFDGLVLEISDILTVMKEHESQRGPPVYHTPPSRPIAAADSVPVRGLDTETEAIMQALKGSASVAEPANFSVVSIVGPVGAGKTLLAEFALNEASKEKHFDIQARVRVADNFDMMCLTIKIIESLGIRRPKDLHSMISMGAVRKVLTEGLKDLRFLIVLDDVWEESATEWENLLIPFNCGKQGSRVIVTTQLESIARKVGSKVTINLQGLDEKAYWELFKACAFGDENPDNRQELEAIARELARQLGGSPLAAIKIGKLLKEDFNVQRWRTISQLKSGNTPEIAPVLERSYQHLPPHLKQCFLSCALLPKNYSFEKDQLIRIWLAMGFAHFDGQDVGDLVDDLARRSIFMYAERKLRGKYVLHPLLHHLADRIVDGEFFRFEGEIKSANEAKILPKARHVYVAADNLAKVAKVLRGKKNLRGLVVDGRLSSEASRAEFSTALEGVLKDLKLLRVVVLGELPGKLVRGIVGLRHLRYLEVTAGDIKRLPESLSEFYHVESVSGVSNYWLLRSDIKELADKCGCMNDDEVETSMSPMESMRGAETAIALEAMNALLPR